MNFGMQSFVAAQDVQAAGLNIQTDGYSVPCIADYNDDGIPDLIVGEKTSGGVGKIPCYLNQGSAATPIYNSYFYIQTTSGDLTVPASGCIGTFPAWSISTTTGTWNCWLG